MRRLLVLACLVVVAAARPTDQAKAKLQKSDVSARRLAQRGPRRKKRKGQATALPSTGAWNASSLAEPWREPWYEHWRRGRADAGAAWGRLDAYERAWARVVSGATVAPLTTRSHARSYASKFAHAPSARPRRQCSYQGSRHGAASVDAFQAPVVGKAVACPLRFFRRGPLCRGAANASNFWSFSFA